MKQWRISRPASWAVGILVISILACKTTTTGFPVRPTIPENLSNSIFQSTPALPTQLITIAASRVPTAIESIPAANPSPKATSIAIIPTQQIIAPSPPPSPAIRLAVIGDYGSGGKSESAVADLVMSLSPDYIITVGDNNYPDGASQTIDERIGQFFASYIYPYHGNYGPGAENNRFYASLGNHDWMTDNAQPYMDYFTLPGNERYYDVALGPVHLFVVDSDSREPDGVSSNSAQAKWLKDKLAASQAQWNLVIFHHSPYSSGMHGSVDWMRWPFQSWGASAVVSGHDHTYERIELDGFPYFVNGLGGGGIYPFKEIINGSQMRYNEDYGALLIIADESRLGFQFFNISGELIDSYELYR